MKEFLCVFSGISCEANTAREKRLTVQGGGKGLRKQESSSLPD